jgi:predicted Fe-Mo cluster-binding NifX family protein
MNYKIAVGSRDGKTVTEHFGGCSRFLIITVDIDHASFSFDGFRQVTPPCADGWHTEDAFAAVTKQLGDCSIVLISRIGPLAEQHLKNSGIDVLEYHGLIEDALKRIIQFYR